MARFNNSEMLVFLKAGVSEGNKAYLFLKDWVFLKGLHLC